MKKLFASFCFCILSLCAFGQFLQLTPITTNRFFTLSGINFHSAPGSNLVMGVDSRVTNDLSEAQQDIVDALIDLSVTNGITNPVVYGAINLNGTLFSSAPTNGVNGQNGTNGVNGSTGTTGSTGPKGDTGDTGPQGIPGVAGADGTNGVNGVNGTNGVNGATGATGSTGAQGIQGIQGIQGVSGSNGTNGVNGINGTNGVNGINGTNGVNGLSGTNGVSAPNPSSLQTNLTSGQFWTNTTSRLQWAKASVKLTVSAIAGNCNMVMLIDTAGGHTFKTNDICGQTTLLTTLGVTANQNLTGPVPAGACIEFLDVSAGGGNSTSIIPGTCWINGF